MPKLQYLGHRSEHFYLTPITPALTAAAVAAPAAKTTSSRLAFVIEYPRQMQSRIHVYEVRPRKDKRGVNLISDALPFGSAVVHQAG